MNRGAIWSGLQTFPQQPDVQMLAVDTANRIAERPSTIVITRNLDDGTVVTLVPQTVRIEVIQVIRGGGEISDAMMAISKQGVVMLGFRGHPTIPNTEAIRGDLFYFQNRQYEIVEIVDTVPGRLLISADLTP